MKGSSLETVGGFFGGMVRLAGSVVRRREGDRGCGGGALKEEEVGGGGCVYYTTWVQGRLLARRMGHCKGSSEAAVRVLKVIATPG